MNTILVPIDFSETSDSALNYAVSLANHLTANLILLHVNPIPVYNNEFGAVAFDIKESLDAYTDLLKNKALLLKKENELFGEVSYFVEVGDLLETIKNYIENKNIDLVVMGITGHSTTIGQVVFGSNAVSLSKDSKVPVFIVPTNYQYKKVTNIAYANEYTANIKEQTGLFKIKYIASLFSADLNVLHVIPDNHLINEMESKSDLYVEQKLENVHHKTFILTNNDASTALLEFIKEHDIDVIVIEQKKHSFIHKLIYPSATKEVAFKSPIPVLTIHS